MIEEKWVKMPKSDIFWAKPASGNGTKEWYQYPLSRGEVVPVPLKVVLVPIGSVGLVPVPIKVVSVPLLPATLLLHIFTPLSPVFVHRLFRDPN